MYNCNSTTQYNTYHAYTSPSFVILVQPRSLTTQPSKLVLVPTDGWLLKYTHAFDPVI